MEFIDPTAVQPGGELAIFGTFVALRVQQVDLRRRDDPPKVLSARVRLEPEDVACSDPPGPVGIADAGHPLLPNEADGASDGCIWLEALVLESWSRLRGTLPGDSPPGRYRVVLIDALGQQATAPRVVEVLPPHAFPDGGVDDGGVHDAGYADADADADAGDGVGWHLEDFEAMTHQTGDGRVEFQVGLGDETTELEWQDWKVADDVRKLGWQPGRHLGLRARLVSPDGLSRAEVGGIRVRGPGGTEEWLTMANPSFGFGGGAHRVVTLPTNRIEVRGSSLVLAEAAVALESRRLPIDNFPQPGFDRVLWSDHTSADVVSTIEDGLVRFEWTLLSSGLNTEYPYDRKGLSRLMATYRLDGDFAIRVRVDGPSSAPGTTATRAEVFAGLEVGTEHSSCAIIRRRIDDDWEITASQPWGALPPVGRADPGGSLIVSLERRGDSLKAYFQVDAATPIELESFCSLSGPVRPAIVFGGLSRLPNDRVSTSFGAFEVTQADTLLGRDSSSPEIDFETADALAPHVDVDPPTGAYEAPLSVSIALSRPADARILYTLDGSDPRNSLSATEFDGPLELRSSSVVTVRAVTDAGLLGPPVIRRYFVGPYVAYWPLDDDDQGGAVRETVHGWNGARYETAPGHDEIWARRFTSFNGVSSYAVLPDSSQFDADAYQVDEGAVSIWLRPRSLNGTIFSKDAYNFGTGGHLTVWLEAGEIRARLQSLLAPYEVRSAAAPLRLGEWHKLTVGFGPPGFAVLLSDRDDRLLGGWVHRSNWGAPSNPYTGGLGASSGGVGNREPLVLGASASLSSPEFYAPLSGRYFEGDLADVCLIGTRTP